MALSLSTTLRNNRLDEIATAVGSGGKINIYAGSVPANVGTALSGQTLLAELSVSGAFAAAASAGVLTVNAVTSDTSANATGTAAFFRVTTSADSAVIQGTVGTSGADLNLNSVSLVSGAQVSISSFTITEANV